MWGAAAQIRGEVKSKASTLIASTYAIPGKLKTTDKIKERIEWLLHKNRFAHADVDTKVNIFVFSGYILIYLVQTLTSNDKEPYGNDLIKEIIAKQWFTNRNGEGVRHLDQFKSMPIPLIALVLTGVRLLLFIENLLMFFSYNR